MAPIRIALVGLSASASTSWAAQAHLPYLLSPRGKSHYEIVALLNSSVEAAEAAKKAFNLPSSVKAYGDPDSLAADPDVDLVSVNTRVDVHAAVARPSLLAGKALYIEWPLASSLEEAEALLADVPASVLRKSIIGLQGRVMPLILHLQSLLAANTIGKVLHSTVTAYAHFTPRDALPASLAYFADRAVGGNMASISYGHIIDYIHTALGPWASSHTQAQLQRPTLSILAPSASAPTPSAAPPGDTIRSNVPDYLVTTGALAPSSTVAENATLTVSLTMGPSFPSHPGLSWLITGTTGSLYIAGPGPYLFSGLSCDAPTTLAHHDFATGEARQLEWDAWPQWQEDEGLGVKGRCTAVLYERYAEWVEGGMGEVQAGKGWPGLEDGVEVLRELEGVWRAFESGA
jgi:predicted dehydrogenase